MRTNRLGSTPRGEVMPSVQSDKHASRDIGHTPSDGRHSRVGHSSIVPDNSSWLDCHLLTDRRVDRNDLLQRNICRKIKGVASLNIKA